MRLGIVATSFVIGSLSLVVACSSTVSGNGQDPGSSSGTNTSSGNTGDAGADSDGSAQSSSGNVPGPSTTEAPVDIDGTCPTLAACGGTLAGSYDYSGGCVDDVFAQARKSCAGLDTTGAKVSVKGTLHFANGLLTRNASSTISGSVVVPATCASGQCALAQQLLKNQFDSVTCTGTSSCTCTINDTASTSNATTYTVSGSTVTTGDGDTYSFCVEGSKLTYKGKAPGSEDGVWTLAKR